MSGCDELTDAKCLKVARALRAWSGALDRAGMAPDGMVSPEDLEAAVAFGALFPEPASPEEDAHGGT